MYKLSITRTLDMNRNWRNIIDNHNYAAARSHLLDREYMDRFATTSAEDLNAALYEEQERRAVPSEQLLNMIASTYLQTHKLAYQNAKASWLELDYQNSLFEDQVLIPRHYHLLECFQSCQKRITLYLNRNPLLL